MCCLSRQHFLAIPYNDDDSFPSSCFWSRSILVMRDGSTTIKLKEMISVHEMDFWDIFHLYWRCSSSKAITYIIMIQYYGHGHRLCPDLLEIDVISDGDNAPDIRSSFPWYQQFSNSLGHLKKDVVAVLCHIKSRKIAINSWQKMPVTLSFIYLITTDNLPTC